MQRRFSTAEAARILGMRDARIRELVRCGLGRPARRGHRYAFTFQDLVILRAAHELIAREVPAARVARALAALAAQLPEGGALSGVRVFADGRDVAVCDGRCSWNPETGQTLLDFDVAALEERVAQASEIATEPPSDDAERAVVLFERAVELEDENPCAACDAYAEALALDPGLVDAYVNLGRLAHEAGRESEAIRLYELALERTPEDPVVHFNLGLAHEDRTGPAAAVRHYERALELDPAFADAHYNLAAVCEKLDRPQQALRHYSAYRRLTVPA